MNSRISLLALALLASCGSPQSDKEVKVNESLMAQPPSVAVPLKTPAVAGSKRLTHPVVTSTAGFVQVDRVDVADERNERAHQYQALQARLLEPRNFNLGAKKGVISADGRATKSSESFQVKVHPQQDHLLVRVIDASSKGKTLRVSIDGKPAGDWILPDIETAEYGEATFAIKGSLVGDRSTLGIRLEDASGSSDLNSYAYWVYGKPERKLVHPLVVKTEGLTMTDRLDVGSKTDEDAHKYVIEKPTYHGTNEYKWPTLGAPFLEDARATKSSESFHVKVTPGRSHMLVKAFDTVAKDQTTRVLVDGTLVGEWKLPNEKSRYGEATFRLPSKFIGSKSEVEVQLQFVSSSKDNTNSLYYWVFTEPNDTNG